MGKGNDFWLDDPEWDLLRRRAENRPVPKRLKQQAKPVPPLSPSREDSKAKVHTKNTGKEVTVNVRLTIPKLKRPDFRRIYKNNRKYTLLAGGAVIGVMLVVGSVQIFSRSDGSSTGGGGDKAPAEEQAKADFNPLLPLDNLSDASGKQSKPDYRYDSEKKVLGYVADYNNTSMTISQQPLPEPVKSGKTDIAAIAQSFKATKLVQTQKGTAHIATDDKTKAQTAVFATDDVLVFVRTNKALDDDEWITYINQLNPAE